MIQAIYFGFGIETDLRRANSGQLIISHDPDKWTPSNDAQSILNSLVANGAFIALNIKEEELLKDLVRLMGEDFIPKMKGFAFDFELCCSDPITEMHNYSRAGFKIAKRMSDQAEMLDPLDTDYIWFDEMDESGILNIHNIDLNKTIYVSPELHGRPIKERRSENFFAICTDYCIAL